MQPGHLLHYVSEDDDGTWMVFVEEYPDNDSDEPIDESQRLVRAGFATMAEADVAATELQRQVNLTPAPKVGD